MLSVDQEPDPPPVPLFQYISTPINIVDDVVNLTQSMVIQNGGALNILRSSVTLDPEDLNLHMIVVEQGGILSIINSSIQAIDSVHWNITCEPDSEFHLENS